MAYTFGTTYYFKSNAGRGRYMNVYGTETVANSRNVCLYDKENIGAQKWIIRQEAGYGKIYTSLAGGNAFALNLHSTTGGNCTMYTAAGNDQDSLLDLLTVNASNNLYRIKLKNYNLYLVAENSANLGNVAWKPLTDSDSFIWKLEPDGYVPPSPQPAPVPAAILNQTFFVKNANTGVYLNVNGYDTVANSTNVNVYNKTDGLAQRWVARQTSTGGKLFTKINEAFALNIYNDNCTMYTAGGNDEDSLLEFVPYDTAQKIYRIKMFRKNKYLASAAAPSGSNAIWVDNIYANDYTLWKFETEEQVFPSGPPAPAEIVNKTFFVKNYHTGSFLNVHGTDTVAPARNVNVYGYEDCQAQRWVTKQTAKGGKLFTKIDEAYALNINTADNNCTMYTAQGYDDDTLLEFVPFDISKKIYRIKMVKYNKYLTVASVDKGANALWTTDMHDHTLWKFETEDEARPQLPAVPAALVNKTFFIKDKKSGLYLNIYGTDTVTNTRNVNIYEAENCLAQRWVARQTVQGGRLHTKIDEAFALNIHVEAGNNCTMYNAQASGGDSVLEFSPVNSAASEYLIKMFHKNKYLHVATDDRGANVYWSDINSGSTVWTFVDESDVIFAPSGPGEMFSKDSSLVTKVMPAHQNNFTKNRAGENAAIEKITIHHMAGNLSIETLGNIWQKPDRRGSSHYGINGNNVGQYVKESDIAWTDGNWESNRRSVTIETANSTGDPTWEIAGASFNTLVKLVADIARRNNFGILVKGQNVTWHSMYSATQCPGPDLLRLMDSIVSEANKLLVEQPATGVYLRKLGTDKFLGLDTSNQIAFVGANDAKCWMKNGETLSDYNDISLKLKVANDGVTPIRSSYASDGVNARCVSDGKGNVMIVAPSSQLRTIGTEKALTATQTFPRFKSKDGDAFKEIQNMNTALDPVKPSAIPDAFKNRLIRIKRNNDSRYLTLEVNGNQKTVALKAPFAGESQLWKVKQLDASGNIFGIVSHADENCTLRMNDVTNGCFLSSDAGSAFASTGVSITHDQEIGGYTIMLSTNHRYLDILTDVDGAVVNSDLMWTKMDSVGWGIVRATSEVKEPHEYPPYVTKHLKAHEIVPVTDMPNAGVYVDNTEYFPKVTGMLEGTWLENSGAEIKRIVKGFYKRVFRTSEDPIDAVSLYSLYGGLYGDKVKPESYVGLPHPGVDIVYKETFAAVARDIYSPCSGTIVGKGSYYVTLEIGESKYLKFVRLDPTKLLNIGDSVTSESVLGVQSNKGNSVPVHLHVEASSTLNSRIDGGKIIYGEPYNPESDKGSLGFTISPYHCMDFALSKLT